MAEMVCYNYEIIKNILGSQCIWHHAAENNEAWAEIEIWPCIHEACARILWKEGFLYETKGILRNIESEGSKHGAHNYSFEEKKQ